MISTGIETGWETLHRFQQHVINVCSPPWPEDAASITSLVLPAVRDVLDSPQHINLNTQSNTHSSSHSHSRPQPHTQTSFYDSKTAKKSTLIGAMFVPAIIDLGRDLDKQNYTTQRIILDLLMIVFFKQTTKTGDLAAIGALHSLAEFVASGDCVENRLLAIQILQTAVGRMEMDSLARVTP